MKFVFLGFDGLNPEFVERYLPELPHFRRLIAEGAWGPMCSVLPVDTPTNWASLATGATASTHLITGFEAWPAGASLGALMGPRQAYPKLRAAESLWEAADRQGRKSLLINYPFGWYSREGLDNTVIVGGDAIKGGFSAIHGTAYYCTRDRFDDVPGAQEVVLRPEGGGFLAELSFGKSYRTEWTAVGELATGELEDQGAGVWARLRVVPGSPPCLVVQDHRGQERARLVPGQWSPYLCMKFGREDGWLRFLLVDLSADGRSLHLNHTMITRSSGWTKPAPYASMLLERVGPYQQGLEADGGIDRVNGFGTTHLRLEADLELFRQSAELLTGYAEVLTGEIPGWDHLYLQFHCTDGHNHRRLAHLIPKDHPCVTPEQTELTEEWSREHYRMVDRVLGQVAEMAASAGAVLVAVSDHSAVPCHTWVDSMRPFMERGWLSFDADGKWDPTGSRIRDCMSRSVYINLQGRHPDGIVDPADYERMRSDIISTLLSLRDPRTGECPVALAARREDLASLGAGGSTFGDVLYFMRPGYTTQPGSQSHQVTRQRLQYGLYHGDEAYKTGYGFQKMLLGTHIDALPDARYPGLCTNRAVLLFHGPGIRRGVRIGGATTTNVAPTLARLDGMDPPAQCEGLPLDQVLA